MRLAPDYVSIRMETPYFVYILASHRRTLYIGVTGDLRRRIEQHRQLRNGTFTERYQARCLVYCEACCDVRDALRREKQLKGWTRARKLELIEGANPQWRDLATDWGGG
jgi:putative endonuclease